MLSKLLKYDLKYMFKNMSVFYILALFFAITTRILYSLDQSVMVNIIGKMNPTESISGKVEKPSDMSGEININPEKDIPTYDGNYIVIPKAYKEQILETKEKKWKTT